MSVHHFSLRVYPRATQESRRGGTFDEGERRRRKEKERRKKGKKKKDPFSLCLHLLGVRENSTNCFHQDRGVLTSLAPFERTTSIDQPTYSSFSPACKNSHSPTSTPLSHSGGYNISSRRFVSLPTPPPSKKEESIPPRYSCQR